MANRIMLNETSYHGAGAVNEIATEVKARGFRKALVCTGPHLLKYGTTAPDTHRVVMYTDPRQYISRIKFSSLPRGSFVLLSIIFV